MKFRNCDLPLTEQDIASVEAAVGIGLPPELRAHYLAWNGGSPDPYVYEDDNLDTVVSECLPLRSTRGVGTALQTYRLLVREKHIVPRHSSRSPWTGAGTISSSIARHRKGSSTSTAVTTLTTPSLHLASASPSSGAV